MDIEIKNKIEALGKGFEDFKAAHKTEIEEVKKNGVANSATTEKVNTLNETVQKLSEGLEAAKAAMNRSRQDDVNEAKGAKEEYAKKHSEEMNKFLRKGSDKEFRASNELMELAKKSNSVIIDEDGGFLVSPEMSSEVVKKIFETSPMRDLASVATIGSDAMEMLEDLDEVESGWVAEKQARPNTNSAKLKMIKIPVHELYAAPLVTQKLLDDAGFNIESWLSEKFAAKFSRDENTAFVNGNGVGKPQGILSYVAGTAFNQIERVQSATLNTMVGDDLIDLMYQLKDGYVPNSTFAMNRLTEKVIRKLKSTTGEYLWQPGLNGGAAATVLGRPLVHFADLAGYDSTTITNNNAKEMVIFGDFKQGYQIVDRFGIRVLRDPYTHKPFVEFYATKRVGGGVKNFEALKVLQIKAS